MSYWKERRKYRLSFPYVIVKKLKETSIINSNKQEWYVKKHDYYCELWLESKRLINKYKSERWQCFISDIQKTYENTDKAFWKYLSYIYKARVSNVMLMYSQSIIKWWLNYQTLIYRQEKLVLMKREDLWRY